jgi:hypothetical protein
MDDFSWTMDDVPFYCKIVRAKPSIVHEKNHFFRTTLIIVPLSITDDFTKIFPL